MKKQKKDLATLSSSFLSLDSLFFTPASTFGAIHRISFRYLAF